MTVERVLTVWAVRIRQERKERAWDRAEMARRLQMAADPGVRAGLPSIESLIRYVDRWEAGEVTVVSERYRLLYAKALGISEADLFGGSDRDVIDLRLPSQPTARGDDDEVKRRAMLKAIGAATLAAPFHGRLESPRRAVDGALHAPTTNSDVDEWERIAYEYAHEVGILAPTQMLPELLADLDEARARLANSSDSLRMRMARVCGQLSALTAIALINFGDSPNACRYWRTALRAVDQVGDRGLQSLIRGRRAVFALYDQRSALSVLALADDAICVADGNPNAGAASGYAAQAQALGLLGRHREACVAAKALSDVFARLPASTIADRFSQWGWSEQRLHHVESHVYSYAGRVSDAVEAQDAALTLYPPSAYQGPAQIEMHKAICLIATGDPSEGARHAIRTVEALPPRHRHDALVRRTAVLALDMVPDGAANISAISEARDMLTLPGGQS